MALLRVRTVLGGLPVGDGLSTFYFQAADDSVASDITGFTAGFWGGLTNRLSIYLNWSVDPVVDTINPTNGEVVDSAAGTAATGSGTASDAPLPLSIQGLLQMRTAVIQNGRRVRGRCFIPALTAAAGQTEPTTAVQNAIRDEGNDLVAASASVAPWSVWSRTSGVIAPITTCTAWDKYAVLRSRRD